MTILFKVAPVVPEKKYFAQPIAKKDEYHHSLSLGFTLTNDNCKTEQID